MRINVKVPDIGIVYDGSQEQLGQVMTGAMGDALTGLKGELRGQVTGAGLGTRLANTWQGRLYPQGRPSFDPSAYVWSKAPKLIDAFSSGAAIVPLAGRFYLAIPTKNVPMKGRKRMTPLDVETSFNQDLIIRRNGNGNLLAFIDIALGRYAKAASAAYGARGRGRKLGQGKRPKPKLVLMFTLVRGVRPPRLLDLPAAANKWADRIPSLVAQRWT
jgi:hypothetical protein